jgi:hypothetical protein
MAVAFVQALTSAQSKTTGTTLAGTVNKTVTVGNRILVAFAADPNSGGTDSCTDNLGNVYTNVNGTASGSGTAGVRVLLYSAPVTVGGTLTAITVTHPSVAARAMQAAEFSGVGSQRTTGGNFATTATNPVQAAVSGSGASVPVVGDLWFGAFADEIQVALVPSAPATGVAAGIGTSGGSGGSNIQALGAYWIADTTTATLLQATTSTAGRWAGVGVAYAPAPGVVTLAASDTGTSTDSVSLRVPKAVATLTDGFGFIDLAKWTNSGGATVVSGMLEQAVDGTYRLYRSVDRFDLQGSSMTVRIDNYPNSAQPDPSATFAYEAQASPERAFKITLRAGRMYCEQTIDGSTLDSTIVSDAYTTGPDVPMWLRISESGGAVTFATSPDRTTWTTRRTIATPTVSTVDGRVYFVTYDAGGVSPGGPVHWDSLNLIPGVEHTLAASDSGTSTTSAALTVGLSTPMAVSDSGTSTTTSGLSVATGLASPDAGTSTTSGALGVNRTLAATDAGTSAGTSAVGVVRVLAVTDAGTATDTGDVRVAKPLAASDAGTSTTTGGIFASRPLAATDAGTSTTTADTATVRGLAAIDSVGNSTTAAAPVTNVALAASDTGTSSTSGVLAGGSVTPLASTDAGTSTDSAAMDALVGLVSSDAGTSTDAADLRATRSLGLTDAGTSTDAADLRATRSLGLTDAGTSTDSATLGISRTLGLTDAGTSTDSAALGIARTLGLTDAGTSTDSAAVVLVRGLSSSDAGTSATAAAAAAILSLAAVSSSTSTTTVATASAAPYVHSLLPGSGIDTEAASGVVFDATTGGIIADRVTAGIIASAIARGTADDSVSSGTAPDAVAGGTPRPGTSSAVQV